MLQSEALTLLKSSQDLAWHAATLEGLATSSMIEAWSAGNGLQNSTGSREPWIGIIDKLSQAAYLYSKASTSDPEPNYSLLTFLYTCCILRHASLLFSVWSAKGWGPLAFTTMLQSGSKPYFPPTISGRDDGGWNHLERLSSVSGISRSSIANVLAQAHGPWLVHLGTRERIAILEAMSSLYGCLGYRRKEAYLLREVLGCIMDLMVCGREEDGLSRMSNPATGGLGIYGLSFSVSDMGWNGVGVRVRESVEGNESILHLLKYICKVFGIDLEAVNLVGRPPGTKSSDFEEFEKATLTNVGEQYGWPELQVGVIREAVAVAEALPDFFAVSQIAYSALKTFFTVLSPGDQYHLYATASRSLATARRRGGSYSIEYWSGRPVLAIALAPISFALIPVEKPIFLLQSRLMEPEPILTAEKDPFLYNPRKIAPDHRKALVVKNEEIQFIVTLQNPYIFEFVLEEISLSTSGAEFRSIPIHVEIPANSIHEIVLSGRAVETGILTIRGCVVQASGGAVREFILPLTTEEDEERLSRKRSSLVCELDRLKHLGLEPFFRQQIVEEPECNVSSKASFRLWECRVIPEQPLLRIRRTSITRNALMLYKGEKSVIRMTLENISTLTVDFLRLAFEDSTMASAQQALAEGGLSVFDAYETEYDLIHKPVFSWSEDEESDILPGQTLTVSVTCAGKVGCTNGTIYLSYSSVRRNSTQSSPDSFFVRQLSYPVMITVYDMLECYAPVILPFPLRTSGIPNHSNGVSPDERPQINDDGNWCLFSIEVRNNYGSSFDVTFERCQEDTMPETVTAVVPPGSTSRVVLPIRRFLLTEKHITQPIPTLLGEQFVVRQCKCSQPETMAERELFWYQEHLLRNIRGYWQETGGTRSGELSLRHQRLSLHMLGRLQLKKAQACMALVPHHSSPGSSIAAVDGKFYAQANEFICLKMEVTNRSRFPLILVMDLEIEPLDYVAHEGMLIDIALGELQSGQVREVETSICFLAHGRFNFSVVVKVVEPWGSVIDAGTGYLCAIVNEGVE